MNVTKIVEAVTKGLIIGKKFLIDNAPIILGIKAGVGIVTTATLASRATAKSIKQIEEQEMRTGLTLTTKEKIKLCFPNYIGTIIEGASSLASSFGSNYLYIKKEKHLSEVILGWEAFGDQVKRKMNESFVNDVKENLQKPNDVKVDEIEPNSDNRIIPYHKNYIIDEEHVLCVEPFTRQRFVANKRVLDIYATKIQDMHMRKFTDMLDTTLNDVLYALELEEIDPVVGESIYWNYEKARVISLDFVPTLLDGELPALKLKYYPEPKTKEKK